MVWHFRSNDFSVIQHIYKVNNQWIIEDYIGRLFKFDDITDDGIWFNPLKGWEQLFYLEKDINIIREATKEITIYEISS